MIIDCFTFFNELDVLRLRLSELSHIVDYFVIVEADTTHTGKKKPLVFLENRNLFSRFLSKIIYVHVADLPTLVDASLTSKWALENFQRNCISRGLSKLDLCPNDVVLISDLDEIPDWRCLNLLPKLLEDTPTVNLVLRNHRYFFNYILPGLPQEMHWLGTVACRVSFLNNRSPEEVRRGDNPPRAGYTPLHIRHTDRCYYENSGWHLSSFGGASANILKRQNVVEGDSHHIESPFTPALNSRHNWIDGRFGNLEVNSWISDKILSIRQLHQSMSALPSYLPATIIRNPIEYEMFFWLNQPIDDLSDDEPGGI